MHYMVSAKSDTSLKVFEKPPQSKLKFFNKTKKNTTKFINHFYVFYLFVYHVVA